MEEMQGQEYDYVIIDQDMTIPKNNDSTFRPWIQKLYTLMSRGKEASIFIDRGLSAAILIGAAPDAVIVGHRPNHPYREPRGIEEEIRAHIEDQMEENIHSGMSREEAEKEAASEDTTEETTTEDKKQEDKDE